MASDDLIADLSVASDDLYVLTSRREEKEFVLRFPDNWSTKSLAGTEALCQVKVKEVFKYDIKELTDEDAPKIAEGATTIAEVRWARLAAGGVELRVAAM